MTARVHGAGSGTPYYVTGRAYWAGPYEGAPFSIVTVTPAIAGPFDLGTVVVRVALFINPTTAQVTARSDAFPTILDGIPLDIRDVTVETTRPAFIINPTSCEVMAATGQETSTAGQAASLSDPFKAGGCTNLPFHPSFAVSTSGQTSKADGASLDVSLAFPPDRSSGIGQQGSEANVHLVKVELPKQLPSRLTTLQKACTAAQFESNPAGCPADSIVGHAKAITPILPVPLEGPAYFVSHGGEAFPNLTIVSVPAAGRLVASGKGLSKASKKASGAGTVKVKLTLTKRERTFLKRHKGRKLKAKVKLTFIPATGGRLTTSVTVLIR